MDERTQRINKLIQQADELHDSSLPKYEKLLYSRAFGSEIARILPMVARARGVKRNFDEKVREERR